MASLQEYLMTLSHDATMRAFLEDDQTTSTDTYFFELAVDLRLPRRLPEEGMAILDLGRSRVMLRFQRNEEGQQESGSNVVMQRCI